MGVHTLGSNTVLGALEPTTRARFAPHFRMVRLQRGDILHGQGEFVDRVYFPLTGLVAVLTETPAGESVQTGMVGCDGAVGAMEVSGSGQCRSTASVQIPGAAARISAPHYREVLAASPTMQTAIERYVELLVAEARQLTACNALHAIEARLGRSILEAIDRGCLATVLPLTQEALAQMLGVRRSTIAACLSKLQRAGLIRTRRAAIEVLDTEGLERIACSCRETLRLYREEISTSYLQERRSSG